MKPNVLVALVLGLILGFVGGRAFTGGSTNTAAANKPAAAANAPKPGGRAVDPTVFKVPIDGSPLKGSSDALVTLVEFSDYQCPFCSRANATVDQLQKDYGNKLRVIMKENPLSFHPRAKPAAMAALAAGEQGKYWEFHDKLFANNKALEDADLEKYATDIGLDLTRWKADLTNPKLSAVIDRDQALAGKLGANGTPAFFINGRFLSGAQPIENFKSLIDEEMGKAEALTRSGTPAGQVYAAIIAKGVDAAPKPAQPQQQAPAQAYRKVDVPADSAAFGPKNAKVTIVEWSDFQCPFCSRVAPTLKQIKETYPNDVRVVFRHQPLSFHANAKAAAEAAEAAHEQGKFWEMHDKLFANQGSLDRATFEKHAQDLGLNLAKFKAALDSGKFRAKVEADSAAGSAVGANGTPTFFINGREFVGAQPFDNFKKIIDEEKARAEKLLASGTKADELYAKVIEEGLKLNGAAPAAPAEPAVQNIEVGSAPVKGPKNAPVTIVAFSDFECPFCGRVIPTLNQIETEYKGKVRVAFKHSPLPFHANAKPAAMAAMAANEQGKFWEYHDKLFANQRALDRASLEKYAQELGLNMGQFKAALDSNKYDAQLSADMAEASRVGVNGTPSFFINGRSVVGAQPFAAFKSIIDEELKKKGGSVVADQK
ncbi:thioredoxin domain-containing protein [Vitiosangium sp. GDMCC 1.1324]|uniref:DsbA family protein n=1 Tax=Vitiosangium sp. (strain GDMCC 1.1324) TaxID=2138576 RepID=UPI000D3C5316|nr:thioredoxin domain-containing protein [Vitiosangium sp. GDMCC 1.1324]PTL75894.1 thioredoxin [Vitiosangium sp. GDMCC 1.1324]